MDSYFISFCVEIISDYAFSECKYLNSITIPAPATKINSWAFKYCEELSSIIIHQLFTGIFDKILCKFIINFLLRC